MFLRLCVLCRLGVCFGDPCWSGEGDLRGSDPMELRFAQFGREEFQFLSRSCSTSSSTEALLLCESAGDAAREEEVRVSESYRDRDPSVGRVGWLRVRQRSEMLEGVGDGEPRAPSHFG